MSVLIRTALFLICIPVLYACTGDDAGSSRQMYNMSEDEIKSTIVVMKTTLADLEAKWGKPDSVSKDADGNTHWMYEDAELIHYVKGTVKKSLYISGIANSSGVIYHYEYVLSPKYED
ncbi:MAG: YjgB family protein [Desulfovibrio sp.]|jgi:hypothetical protein|nr:YjgB family protein [Desulfovibrio sp.]